MRVFLPFVFCFIAVFANAQVQIQRVSLNDSTFLKAVDWYIDSTTAFYKKIQVSRDFSSLIDIGCIGIELMSIQDSLVRKVIPDSSIGLYSKLVKIIQFKISLVVPEFRYTPPTYFFKYKGYTIVIYTGLESILKTDKTPSLNKIGAPIPKIHPDIIPTYVIKLGVNNKNGFEAKVPEVK